MSNFFPNPFLRTGIPPIPGLSERKVSFDPSLPLELLERCPAAAPTPLRRLPELANDLGVGEIWLKDETSRMGLGSFKALGAAYVIALEAMEQAGKDASDDEVLHALVGRTYACASAGNHGLSVAAGARLFGAKAAVWISDTVPEAFCDRLRSRGAEVIRSGRDYEESLVAAKETAEKNGWTLLSDTSWPGYEELPARIMEGYLVMGEEAANEIDKAPTHIFLQAGVGGLAAAMAAYARNRWGDAPIIVVVEPEAAQALLESVRAGEPVKTSGPVSCMGRLDCKEPSYLALRELSSSANWFCTVSDAQSMETVELLRRHGIGTSSSGGAGVAGLQHAGEYRDQIGLSPESRVLAFISEGKEDSP